MRNFYQVLGVNSYVLHDEIQAAYSKKMKDVSLSAAERSEVQHAANVLLKAQSRYDYDVYLRAHEMARKGAHKDALRCIWHFIKKRDDNFWKISAEYHWESSEFSQSHALLRFHVKNKNDNSWHFLADYHVCQGKVHCEKKHWHDALLEYRYAAVALENKKEKSREDLEWMVELLNDITDLHYACNDNEEVPHLKRDEYKKMLEDLNQQEEANRLKFRSVMFAQNKILKTVLPDDLKHEVKAAEKVPEKAPKKVPTAESEPMRIFATQPQAKVPMVQESSRPSSVIQSAIVSPLPPPPPIYSIIPVSSSPTRSLVPVTYVAQNSLPRHSVMRRSVAVGSPIQAPGMLNPDMKSPETPRPGKSCVIS